MCIGGLYTHEQAHLCTHVAYNHMNWIFDNLHKYVRTHQHILHLCMDLKQYFIRSCARQMCMVENANGNMGASILSAVMKLIATKTF